jgi:hypothetical protein
MSFLSNYIAIFLDQNSKGALGKLRSFVPKDWVWYGDHMTIKFSYDPMYSEDFPEPYGELAKSRKKVALVATHIGLSDQAIAVKVEGYPLEGKLAHITLAVPQGGSPKNSNSITNWKKIKSFTMHGTIMGNGDAGEVLGEIDLTSDTVIPMGDRWNDQLDGGNYTTSALYPSTGHVKYGGTMAENIIKSLTKKILEEELEYKYRPDLTTRHLCWVAPDNSFIKANSHFELLQALYKIDAKRMEKEYDVYLAELYKRAFNDGYIRLDYGILSGGPHLSLEGLDKERIKKIILNTYYPFMVKYPAPQFFIDVPNRGSYHFRFPADKPKWFTFVNGNSVTEDIVKKLALKEIVSTFPYNVGSAQATYDSWTDRAGDENLREIEHTDISNLPFVNSIEQAGGKVYQVGGAVRDSFLNTISKDLDIMVAGLDAQVVISILSKYGNIAKNEKNDTGFVGGSFAVIKFKPFGDKEDIDVALARTEKKVGQGYGGFEVTANPSITLNQDLERRDFTINAIAKDIRGQIYDPFNGQEDLKNKIIRMVSPKAFAEDPLRMLRAVQFAARFGFTIEPNTWSMIRQNAEDIQYIKDERFVIEFDKIVHKTDIKQSAELLVSSGLYRAIFGDDFRGTYDQFPKVKTLAEFIFLLTKDSKESPSQFYVKRFGNWGNLSKIISAFELTRKEINTPAEERWLMNTVNKIDPKAVGSFVVQDKLKDASMHPEERYPRKAADLAVTGGEIDAMGITGGQHGQLNTDLLNLIYGDQLENTREAVMGYIQQNIDKYKSTPQKIREIASKILKESEVLDVYKFQDTHAEIEKKTNFKNWFANSKIVDSENKPLVVYHGQPPKYKCDFNTGKIERTDPIKINKFSNDNPRFLEKGQKGFYFTVDKNEGKRYAEGGNLYDVYLKIENPYFYKHWEDDGEIKNACFITPEDYDKLIKLGYDGVIILKQFKNFYIERGEWGEVIAFYPNQIKSVSNVGTFNASSDDIIDGYDYANKSLLESEGNLDGNFEALVQQVKQRVPSLAKYNEFPEKNYDHFQLSKRIGKADVYWHNQQLTLTNVAIMSEFKMSYRNFNQKKWYNFTLKNQIFFDIPDTFADQMQRFVMQTAFNMLNDKYSYHKELMVPETTTYQQADIDSIINEINRKTFEFEDHVNNFTRTEIFEQLNEGYEMRGAWFIPDASGGGRLVETKFHSKYAMQHFGMRDHEAAFKRALEEGWVRIVYPFEGTSWAFNSYNKENLIKALQKLRNEIIYGSSRNIYIDYKDDEWETYSVKDPEFLHNFGLLHETRDIVEKLTRESLTLYHGSPHKFDKFSTEHMGTGEGAQAFGWGLYFTELQDIAQHYASINPDIFNADMAYITKYIYGYNYNSFDIKRVSTMPIPERNNLINQAYEREIATIKRMCGGSDRMAQIVYKHSEAEEIKLETERRDKYLNISNTQQRNMYQVTVHKGKTPDQYTWMEWDRVVPPNMLAKIRSYISTSKESDYENVDSSYQIRQYMRVMDDPNYSPQTKTGEKLYRDLSSYLGEKGASMLLLRCGIDGIKYAAESISHGKTSDTARGFDYVVFDDKAVTLDTHKQLEEKKTKFTKQQLTEMVMEAQRSQLKRLVLFDMDSTLINSPMPEFGREEYKQKTGGDFPSEKAWWSVPESLDTNVFDITAIAPVFNQMRDEQRRSDTMVVVMTNRLDTLERQVKRVLRLNRINPDALNMASYAMQNKGERILQILKENPSIRYVAFYDDQEKNIMDVRNALRKKGITYDLYNCQDGKIRRT